MFFHVATGLALVYFTVPLAAAVRKARKSRRSTGREPGVPSAYAAPAVASLEYWDWEQTRREALLQHEQWERDVAEARALPKRAADMAGKHAG